MWEHETHQHRRRDVLLGNSQVTSHALPGCTRRGIGRGGRLRCAISGRSAVTSTFDLRRTVPLMPQHFHVDHPGCGGRQDPELQTDDHPVGTRRQRHLALDTERHAEPSEGQPGSPKPHRTNPDRIRGVEGDATRGYCQAVGAALHGAGFTFGSRTRRPPRDPANSLLSWTYALLTAEVAGRLDVIGLDPQVGFLYQPKPRTTSARSSALRNGGLNDGPPGDLRH